MGKRVTRRLNSTWNAEGPQPWRSRLCPGLLEVTYVAARVPGKRSRDRFYGARADWVPAACRLPHPERRANRDITPELPALVTVMEFGWNSPMASGKKYEVTVTTQVQYIADQSDEANGRYVFAYTINIRNTGSIPAQLISRHWIITDARNQVQEVRGLGVVGAQPLLKPDESFEYTSGTAIATPVGTMRGSYQMVAEDGTHFDAAISEFTLSVPRVLH